ncbi:MAG TPA: biopolymer transporter ExbD, partial [Candidatus Baltobacteraceae bacterium]|nr:biopolymer transporter ExbD [Candidatus Baltobacteraceae bacterium]
SNAKSSQPNKKNEIDVTVNSKGVIYVDTTKTDAVGIYRVMYDTMKKRGKKHVSLTADAKAPWSTIIRVLDAAKDAGLEDVGFVTS